PSVIAHSGNVPIIIADNRSTDDSVSFLESTYPSLRIIFIPQNEGYSKGYNIALREVDAEYYILLNSDVEVTEGWLKVIDFMIGNPAIAVCQPKIKSYREKSHFEFAGAAGGFIDKLGYPFCRGRIFDELEPDLGQYDDTCEIFWATGACFFVRSKVFWDAGGFDDDFFAHMEEIDLCWRIKRLGYKVFYYAESEVYHLGGGTLAMGTPRKTYLNFRNGLILLYKNLPESKLLPIILQRMVLDGVAGMKFLLSGGFYHCVAIIQAHLYLYSNFKKVREKRLGVQQKEFKGEISGILNESLVWNYFIKKKKKFSELIFKYPK
ncbi:MAG TPA: glycosyltransferase family 2 protein, partial [Cytophagaceae bacterium]